MEEFLVEFTEDAAALQNGEQEKKADYKTSPPAPAGEAGGNEDKGKDRAGKSFFIGHGADSSKHTLSFEFLSDGNGVVKMRIGIFIRDVFGRFFIQKKREFALDRMHQ